MTITVFHADLDKLDHRACFELMLTGITDALVEYKKVAEVETESLMIAFELTNHIITNWTQNALVKPLNGDRHRSTSVGDLMLHDKKLYRIEGYGFTEISPKDVPHLTL